MSHTHNILDTDRMFLIDPISGSITNLSQKSTIVQYNHNSERFTFEVPRFIEGHDMSLCDRVEVHYSNVSKNKRERNDDVFIVTDIRPDEDEVLVTWLISRNATQIVGSLNFSISFVCYDESGDLTYNWRSDIFKGITVLASIENAELVISEYPDLYEQLKKDIIDSIPPSGGEIDPAEVEQIVINYLAENPPAQGEPGADGADGVDGVSPVVLVEAIDGGHRVTITDANGTNTIDVLNGKDGADGVNGQDGHTPVKGVDYYTEADKEELVTEVVSSLSESGMLAPESIDPSTVVFPDGVQTTYAIGNVELENGMGTLVQPGGTLSDFFNIFIDEQNPVTTDPSVSLTFGQAKAYEVGSKVTPTYSASLSAGSYTYGPATGVTASAWEVTDTSGNKSTAASGSFPEFTVADGTSYKITAKATHGEGTIPLTNTKNEYPDGQIKAGSKSATSGAVTGYRNTFYGTLTAKNTTDSSTIRGLSGKSGKTLANGNSFTIAIPVGALRVVFAYPATLRDVTSVKDVNGMNAEINSSFMKSTVAVEGANSHTAIDYKVYVLDYAEANGTANKYTVTI